jgi:DNA-binding GntR family transcriptional regulator
MLSFMSPDVTRILSAIEQGDPHAAEQLLPLVYEELRKLAARRLQNDWLCREIRRGDASEQRKP